MSEQVPIVSAEGARDAVEGIQAGIQAFAADMRRRGIHVGIDGVCCTCDQQWPCATSRGESVHSE